MSGYGYVYPYGVQIGSHIDIKFLSFVRLKCSINYTDVKQNSAIHQYAENHQGQKILNAPRIVFGPST